jgi:hypothetical protein
MRILIAAMAALAGAPALAQSADIPRTVEGRPDFHGYWVSEFLSPLQRPDKINGLIIPPEKEADAIKEMTPDFGEVYDPELDYFFPRTLLKMNGELRSSLITEPGDGKLPLTALGEAAIKGFKRDFDGPENRPDAERCVDGVGHAPLRVFGNLAPHQILQTGDAVVIVAEDMNPVRIVPLDARKTPAAMSIREGHSTGRWEGDTLVVETTGFRVEHPSGIIWRGEAVVTEDSKVTERFTLVSPDEILFQFTIVDPALYTKPWLAEFPLHRTRLSTREYACHEGNHAMLNILTAARMGRQEDKPPAP